MNTEVSFIPDESFVNNISLIMMCRNIIEENHKLGGSAVRHQGAYTASIETYLDFWFNALPLSVDTECRPICAVSSSACYIMDEEGNIVEAQLNAPIYAVVRAFSECRTRHKGVHDRPSVAEVVEKLGNDLSGGLLQRESLCGWQQFYLPAKVSVLELRNKRLEEDNRVLRMNQASCDEAIANELPAYAGIIRDGESKFNSFIDDATGKIKLYKTYRRDIHFNRQLNDRLVVDAIFMVSLLQDAIEWNEYSRRNAFRLRYGDLPPQLASLSISEINKICGTNLKS